MGRMGHGTPTEPGSLHYDNHLAPHQPSQTMRQTHSYEATTTPLGCGQGRDVPNTTTYQYL